MRKELELIAEVLRDAGVRYYDVLAAGLVSKLSEHGYSIVSTPPLNEKRHVQLAYPPSLTRPDLCTCGWEGWGFNSHAAAAAAAAAEEDQ